MVKKNRSSKIFHIFGYYHESDITSEFYDELLSKFQGVLVVQSSFKSPCRSGRFYRVYVRGYLEIPPRYSPGREFRQVEQVVEGTDVDSRVSEICRVLKQGGQDLEHSVVVMPAPSFVPSEVATEEWEMDSTKGAIWVRWK